MVFLRQLGLEEYIELFRQHDIRMSNLPDITDDQLQEMGVSVGHRMQLQAKVCLSTCRTSVTTMPHSFCFD